MNLNDVNFNLCITMAIGEKNADYRIVTELLALHVSPEDIYNLLRQIGLLQTSKDQDSRRSMH